MKVLNRKVAVLIAIVLFSALLSIQLASAAIYYTPTYANVSENFMLNVTVSAPAATGNVTQIIVFDYSLPSFAQNQTSNSTSYGAGIGEGANQGKVNFLYAPGINPAWTWYNESQSPTGLIANGSNLSFTIYMNNTIAGAPSGYRLLVCIYNSTNSSLTWNARSCNADDPFFVQAVNITIGMNFGFSGYVKNDTGDLQNGTNVTIYEFVAGAGGPPTETLIASAIAGGTGTTGFFRFSGINGSKELYKIKLLYNNSVRATLIGPNLPPFPSNMFYPTPSPPGMEGMPMMKKMPAVNGSTFYLQPAVTINVSAVGNVPDSNSTSNSVKFGYELIDQAVGFPIESNVRNAVWNKEIVVPIGRAYTLMLVRDSEIFPEMEWCFEEDTPVMNATACPSPPISKEISITNLSTDAGGQGGLLNITVNLTYSDQYLSGCINLSGNTSLVNITNVITRLVPWPGFVPPMDAEISDFNATNSSDNLVYNDARCHGSWAFYNMSLMGAGGSGVSYLIEFYAKNASNEAGNPGGAKNLAMFQNVTMMVADKWINFTLRPLTGTYNGTIPGAAVNTSRMKIAVQNSTGGALTTSMHMAIKVKHPVFGTMHYIVEDLSGGITYLPILNNSNWAKVSVYPNEAPPVEKTLDLTKTQNNITVQVSEFTFRRPLPNGSLDSQSINVSNKDLDPMAGINLTFYRNADECNTPNPPDATCLLTRMDANDFNPMVVMMAGKVNLELKMTGSGTTLYFINFDLLSAKPPTNSIMSNNASSASANAQTWEAGSFVPHVYDYAYVVMPYSDTSGASNYINESYSFNMSLPHLRDENWAVVWNRTNGDTVGSLPDDYTDYNVGAYAPLLTAAGAACSTTNTTDVCYWNKDNNTFNLKVPHFSGIGSSISGLVPATTSSTTTTADTGSSSGGAGDTVVTESRTFSTIAANSENTFRISKADSIGVDALIFTATEALENVKVEVKKLIEKPSSVSSAPDGGLYRYIEIDAPKLAGKLKEARIQFIVTTKWLDDNDYQPEHIRLARFADGSWRELTTSILSEQSDKVYYEATSPGFSYFAIIGKKAEEEKEAPAANVTTPSEELVAPEITPAAEEAKESAAGKLVTPLLIIVGVLVVLFLAVLGYRKKHALVFWREPTDKERQGYVRGEFLKRKKQQSWGSGKE
ncbi:MAG: PGF-pre-PGF domain-containing protein [Nanoarchaeota archaeon]|nr:PGF-pre-PGF domain-containing protein [Nanoarchaeota archaeon]